MADSPITEDKRVTEEAKRNPEVNEQRNESGISR